MLERAGSGSPMIRPRQFKAGAEMDFRWWFWNVCFALLPAALIALYCEVRGKPRMRAFHRDQELAELRLVMGEDAYDETRAVAILEARAAERREPTTWEQTEAFYEFVVEYGQLRRRLPGIFGSTTGGEEEAPPHSSSSSSNVCGTAGESQRRRNCDSDGCCCSCEISRSCIACSGNSSSARCGAIH